MKRIETYVMLAGLLAFGLTVQAEQAQPPADPAFARPDAEWDQDYQVQDTQEDIEVSETDSDPLGETTVLAALSDQDIAVEELTETETTTEEVEESNEPVVIEVDTADSDIATDDNSPVDEEEVQILIPLIVMDEVPLMDAIRNLARQAMINYMVDPAVPYGQIGQDGRVTPQPVLSIRWEDLTAEQALLAVLNNYNLQMSEDVRAKIFRVTVKDPTAPDPLVTEIIQLKYASPSNVVDAVKTTFVDKRSKVVADVRTSQIVVVATDKEMQSVKNMVNDLDKPTRQVLIESRIIETTMNPKTIKGVNWTGTIKEKEFTFGNNAEGGVLTDPGILWNTAAGFTPAIGFLNSASLSATLSFLNEDDESKQIATPRMVTLDNEPARISVTRAHPIFKNTAGTQGSPGGSEVTYTNLGVILDVTPRISANNTVNLKVVPEVSRVFATAEKVVADTENQADIYDIRRMQTRVLIPSGNTLVMGGLLADDTREGNIKVPILGDIPILGILFREESKERGKINLLIFVTPTIVEDSDFQQTPTDFLQTKFEGKGPDPKDWTWWDSGKPADWRKKKDSK